MRSVEDMAHEYALVLLGRAGHSTNFISQEAYKLAKAMHAEADKLNRGVPTAILEADRRKCEHCWVDATVDGSVRDCIKCGQTEVREG